MGVFSEMPLGGGRETERRESKLLIEAIAIDASKKFLQNPRKSSSFFKVQLWLQILEALIAKTVADSLQIDPTPLRSIVNDTPSVQLHCVNVRQFSGLTAKANFARKIHPKRSTQNGESITRNPQVVRPTYRSCH